ncbi:MAG: oligosaccharide flippase family protein [Micrococcales bacterium]|nr:oligosaccharide flippase family protein [Micrococcales bacterium]
MNSRTIAGFAVGPLTTAAISVITVPAVAWAWPAEDVGRYNLMQVSVSFVVLVAALGLDQGYVREFHEVTDSSVLVRSAFAPGLLTVIAMAVPALLFAEPLALALFGKNDARLAWVLVATSAAALVARYLSLILRMQERALAFSVSQALPKLLFLAVLMTVGLLSTSHRFLPLAAALLISWLGAVAVTAWSTRDTWAPAVRHRMDPALTSRLLRYSFPLMLTGLAYWALTATGSLMLRSLSTLAELGVYSVAVSFAGAAVVVQTIFSVIWAPVVYRWAASNQDMAKVDRVADQMLALVAVLFCLVGTCSSLVDVVLPERYAMVKYAVLATIAVPLLYALSEVTGIGINLSRRTSWSVAATLAALGVSVILSLLLVPTLGARGAALASMLGYLAFFFARTEASRRTWRGMPRARLYMTTTALCALATAGVVWGPTSGHWYALPWGVATVVVLSIFRREWRTMAQTVRAVRTGA